MDKVETPKDGKPANATQAMDRARAQRAATASGEKEMPAGQPTTVKQSAPPAEERPKASGRASGAPVYATDDQQREILHLCIDKGLHVEEVINRYPGVSRTGELSQERVADAIAWLKSLPDANPEPGSGG